METPEFAVPPEVVAAFQQLAAQAGISEECVTGIADGIGLVGTGLSGLPAELQQLVTDLAGALQDAIENQDPGSIPGILEELLNPSAEDGEVPVPIGGGIVAGLELIATTLAEDCQPALPTGDGTDTPAPTTPPAATPTQQPPAVTPMPQTPAPVAQPVAYLGYAPTGADAAAADDTSVPLTALAGGLLLAGAGAAGYGMRGRAVRPRD